MPKFEVRVGLIKEIPLPDKYTGGETKHSITREIVLKVLLVKNANVKVWE